MDDIETRLYDDQGYLVENSIGCYGVGDRDPLVINHDGSLDLSHKQPDPNQAANWLPAPDDGLELVLRLSWPTHEVLNGTWVAPTICRIID